MRSNLAAQAADSQSQWITMAITNPANMAKVEAAVTDEIEKALKAGFDAKEVEAAKKGWRQSRNVQRSQDAALALRLVSHEHESRTITYEEDLEKKVAGLTPEQVNTTVRKHLNPASISIFRAGDFKNVQ